MLSASKVQKLPWQIADVRKRPTRRVDCLAKAWSLRTVLPSAMIAVRDKSVEKHDRRDAQRTQDQLRKNTNAALGHIRKRDLFPGAGFQTKILALDTSRLEPLPYQGAHSGTSGTARRKPTNVRFVPKADIGVCLTDVCFTPESGHLT